MWDALTSNRPYRSAWSKEKVIEYLRSQVGTQFDPRVVETFVSLVNGKDGNGDKKMSQ